MLTPRLGLNASFAHVDALVGDIAFVSQSGTERVAGYVIPENLAMRRLALEAGFVADPAASDADAVRVVLLLQPVTPAPDRREL